MLARSIFSAFLCVLFAASDARPLAAQLRPYDPFDWEIFDAERTYFAGLGANLLVDQRAALAGTEGTLLELGSFRALARSGRIAVEGAGTIYRSLDEMRSFAEPMPGTHDGEPRRRSDTGDFRVATTVLLTRPGRPAAFALRFGTRLPTTDDRIGLERDQTDFFGLAVARLDRGPLRATAEAGVGIHGTAQPEVDQSDVLVFSVGAERRSGAVRPGLFLVGHADGLPDRAIRGNEELAELRFQLLVGQSRWLQVQVVRGLTDFSPSLGLLLAAGWTG